ncbi:MAG TPA: polyphosphate kinase 1 [Terriglobia bacterium]|nr:polyphosphate kinase 1 [Terriglobia bacterium]
MPMDIEPSESPHEPAAPNLDVTTKSEANIAKDLQDPRLYIDRELSLLQFQYRVLEEAQDPRNPLLERVKFIAIVGSNLDEFFMVRVAGLQQQIAAGVIGFPEEGQTPAVQLAAVRGLASKLMVQTRDYFRQELLPELAKAGIVILNYSELEDRQRARVEKYFQETVFPVLTPLAFDPGRPFPHISNLSLNLAILIRDKAGNEHFARLKVPDTLPALVPIKKSSGGQRKDGTIPFHHYFVWLEELIASNLSALFPGMEILEAHPFHVTRDADPVIQDLEADDLLETVEESVRKRRFGAIVRLTVDREMPKKVLEILVSNLEADPRDVYTVEGPLALGSLMNLYGIDRYDLKDTPFVPYIQPVLENSAEDGEIFAAIRRGPILLHHPYDSFKAVVDFLNVAATDPDVLAIKIALYRVGRNSPVVAALLKAMEHNKQVAVLVELKARFDEESNIQWARALESEGVHVVYGLLGLKTHSKVALVVRREGRHIRRYVHLATGNYNPVTAQLYTDFGYFTCDDRIGADVTDLFNYLTGYSIKADYQKLLVAPINLRSRAEELIRREIEHQQKGQQGHLIFKTNALVDKAMIRLLYEASQAGVKVDLLVRGICCLRPGLPGVSENIRVVSIVGRFLEHSRVYYFRNGGAEEIYLGSADLMPRNLDMRVEVVFPVEDLQLVRYLRDEVLEIYRQDNVKARHLSSDGTYHRVEPNEQNPPLNSQSWFLTNRIAKTSKPRTLSN